MLQTKEGPKPAPRKSGLAGSSELEMVAVVDQRVDRVELVVEGAIADQHDRAGHAVGGVDDDVDVVVQTVVGHRRGVLQVDRREGSAVSVMESQDISVLREVGDDRGADADSVRIAGVETGFIVAVAVLVDERVMATGRYGKHRSAHMRLAAEKVVLALVLELDEVVVAGMEGDRPAD